jgi:hypothetical protein
MASVMPHPPEQQIPGSAAKLLINNRWMARLIAICGAFLTLTFLAARGSSQFFSNCEARACHLKYTERKWRVRVAHITLQCKVF